ncbi:leucine-rich repeat domain-containing protein [Neochlamydia sp. AcF95]|uniref:leucine-rich repeat domain-containing protein n=1 Tax=Neochlamydia sp. AcF95 TaxID=2795734 RepID=UPI0032D56DED
MPEEIGQLSKLQDLQLSNNQLTALPASIEQLTKLQILGLSYNHLTTLPKLPKIRVLEVDGNLL